MTQRVSVALSRWERKERLGHGGVKRVAEVAGVDPSLVSRVVNGRQRHDRIEQIITGMIGRQGEAVFPSRDDAHAA